MIEVKFIGGKYVANINGKVVKRFAPTTKPEELTAEIEALLK